MYFYNNSENPEYGNSFCNYKANGTKASSTSIIKDDLLASFQGHGYDIASDFHAKSSSIRFYASQNHTSTANGGYLMFETNPDNTIGALERLLILANGNVGIGTTTLSLKLDVSGVIQAN